MVQLCSGWLAWWSRDGAALVWLVGLGPEPVWQLCAAPISPLHGLVAVGLHTSTRIVQKGLVQTNGNGKPKKRL